MDAISFVMGVRSAKLRSERLQDLIFRVEGENAAQNRRRASVAAIYQVGEDDDVDDKDEGDEIRFERRISATGVGSYRLDGIDCR
jgi:structural maintenance of chromosome 1